jgi:hypothetical protein
MTNPNYENHMVLEQDKADRVFLTTAEIKLEEQKQVALDAEIREKAESVFLAGRLDEVICGQTREYWLNFYYDIICEPEYVMSLASTNSNVVIDTAKTVRELAIEAIIREMEK